MMQPKCLVFAGRRGLDELNTRQSVCRIPEVSRILKEAQAFIDQLNNKISTVDLFSFLNTQDEEFSSKPKLRSLLASIVQIGLFNRYVKVSGYPDFIIGTSNSCSALKVCSSRLSLENFLHQNDYIASLINEDGESIDVETEFTLSGLNLEEYEIFNREEANYSKVEWDSKDCYQIITSLFQDYQVEQFIHIGPSLDFRKRDMEKHAMGDISLSNSVEMDPILNSFWLSA